MTIRTFALPLVALAACTAPSVDATAQPGEQISTGNPFTKTVVADFDAPWAMTFLPGGRMLVTEKDGRLLLVEANGQSRQTVATLPVDSAGQGALMDVVLAPDFAKSRMIYLSASMAGEGGKGVVLMRAKLAEQPVQCVRAPCPPRATLEGMQEVFRATPFVTGNGHYSGRIAFSADGKYLYFTNGERQKFEPAQDPKATLGKVLRFTTADMKPAGDPGLTAKGFHPAIWSYGHRNLLGIAFDARGNLWNQEMGPEGGDELNLVLAGRNYGYPRVSNGRNYRAATDDIPDHKPGDGYEAPKVWWTPVISPGGLMIYSGKLFPQWKGDAFIGGLSSKALVRVDLDGTAARKGDQWPMEARIREVDEAPDGAIFVLEDGAQGSQGRLIKLTPAGR